MRAFNHPTSPVDVLIAEGDGPTRAGLRMLLEQQGYRCVEAKNGREALDLARDSLPRCVLLDLAMPEMDGFAVARQLRADPRTRSTHIHCITGRTDEGIQERATAAGCEMFLAKHVDICTLLHIVKPRLEPPESTQLTALN
jgi:CheY-like chemotaxis protein